MEVSGSSMFDISDGRLNASYSFTNHVMIGTISAGMFPENSLARAIIDAMNSFSSDFPSLTAVRISANIWILPR